MVGVTGVEPATSSSRTMRATRLRYTPTFIKAPLIIGAHKNGILALLWLKVGLQVWTEHFGDGDAAVCLLVIFHDCNQRTAHCQGRTV